MTKRMEKFILNEFDGAVDVNTNKRISKDECVRKYEKACFDRDCTKVTYEKEEEFVKFTAKFNDRIPLELVIDIKKESQKANKKYFDRLKESYLMKKQFIKRYKDVEIKKFFLRAGIIIGGAIALSKYGPVVLDKMQQASQERYAIENQEAMEMQDRVERIQGETAASEARNEIYKGQAQQEEKAVEQRELHQQYLQNKQSLDIREQARQYQDITTMSNVMTMDEYNALYGDTTEDLPYIK